MARKQNDTNEFEQPPVVQPNPYAGYVPLSYRMVSSGITPAPRPSQMVQLAPVVMPLTVMPYASGDQGYYGEEQQY